MPRKAKVPPAEVSLAEVLAIMAEFRRDLAEMQRDRKREAAERKAERAEREAERKREAAERKAERAEREAERKREAARREAERKRDAAEREAERKRDAAALDARLKKERAEHNAYLKEEMAKHDARIAKERAEFDAHIKKERAEHERKMADWEEKMQLIRDEVGYFVNGEGEMLEDQAYNALWESKRIGDIRLTDIHQNMHEVVDGKKCEYDIVAENGKTTVVLESKRTLRLTDVRRFVKRLSLFDRAFPEMAEGKTVQGGMIYQTVRNREETVAEALKAGLLLLHAEGKKGLRQVKSVADSGRPADRGK